MITNEQLDALVASKYATLASKKIFKNHKEKILKGIQEEISSLVELSSSDVCQKRFHFFNLSDVKVSDYRERILHIPEVGFILAGIRFKNLDIGKPFISVIPGFDLREEHVEMIRRLVFEEFKIFHPFSFQMTLTSAYFEKRLTMQVDRFYVVGDLQTMVPYKANAELKTALMIPLELDFYDQYLDEYQIFHHERPNLKSEVHAETVDSLQESLESQLLYKIMIEGEFAGIIAGIEKNYHGLSGVCIREKLLFKKFRGKGFGSHFQNDFAHKVKDRFEVLWGTIAPQNEASLKTALENKREIIETDYFISIDEKGFYES